MSGSYVALGIVLLVFFVLLFAAMRKSKVTHKPKKPDSAPAESQTAKDKPADKKADDKPEKSKIGKWVIGVPILAAIIWFVGVPAVRWATSPSREWKQSVRERAGIGQQTMVRVVMKRDLVATAKGTERIPLDPAFCTHIESLEAVPFIIHFSSRGKVDSLMMPAEGNGPPLPYPTEWVKLAARGKDSVNVVVMQTIKGN